jgi:hypothetical protein
MTKVKLIVNGDGFEFERDVNDFIKDKKVIDIKHTIDTNTLWIYHHALIIYEED